MIKKVLVPIANGTEELEAVSIIDCLRRAGADVTVASVSEKKQIIASRKTLLTADKLIRYCVNEKYDLIALPGGMPGAEHLRDSRELTEMLKEQFESGRLYAAICASPAVVLQPQGLLKGRKATCHPAFVSKLDNKDSAGEKVVVDSTCITSQGAGTALPFSLKLVEILFGAEKAKEVAAAMVTD